MTDAPTEAQAAADHLAGLEDRTPDGIYRGTQGFSERALTAGLTSITTGGGASTLTDLTDVTGQPGVGKSPVDDGSSTFPLTRVTTEDDLNAILATVASVDMHDIGGPDGPPFAANWRNIGEPWATARYRQLANSTVRMQGTVMCQDATILDATWIPIFQLPADAAPDENLEFSTLTNDDAISRMYVWADGWVIWGGYAIGAHAPISRLPLNGLSWSTANPARTLTDTITATLAAPPTKGARR